MAAPLLIFATEGPANSPDETGISCTRNAPDASGIFAAFNRRCLLFQEAIYSSKPNRHALRDYLSNSVRSACHFRNRRSVATSLTKTYSNLLFVISLKVHSFMVVPLFMPQR